MTLVDDGVRKLETSVKLCHHHLMKSSEQICHHMMMLQGKVLQLLE